jgi:hypothetical protein
VSTGRKPLGFWPPAITVTVSWLSVGVFASMVTVATIVESHDEDGLDAQGFV